MIRDWVWRDPVRRALLLFAAPEAGDRTARPVPPISIGR